MNYSPETDYIWDC